MANLPTLGRVERYLASEIKRRGTLVAALIDPEETRPRNAARTALSASNSGASIILVGGSTISDQSQLNDTVRLIKARVHTPVILFPGNITGISRHADAILFSCLLNSSNPYFIIGAQALGAPLVRRSGLESIPMGYLVFGTESTTAVVGQVRPIPYDKHKIAVMYALAAQYLGMRMLYLEGGSGTTRTIPSELVKAVRRHFEGTLLVGGGIDSAASAAALARAGADVIVIGNLLNNPGFEPTLKQIVSAARKSLR